MKVGIKSFTRTVLDLEESIDTISTTGQILGKNPNHPCLKINKHNCLIGFQTNQ